MRLQHPSELQREAHLARPLLQQIKSISSGVILQAMPGGPTKTFCAATHRTVRANMFKTKRCLYLLCQTFGTRTAQLCNFKLCSPAGFVHEPFSSCKGGRFELIEFLGKLLPCRSYFIQHFRFSYAWPPLPTSPSSWEISMLLLRTTMTGENSSPTFQKTLVLIVDNRVVAPPSDTAKNSPSLQVSRLLPVSLMNQDNYRCNTLPKRPSDRQLPAGLVIMTYLQFQGHLKCLFKKVVSVYLTATYTEG